MFHTFQRFMKKNGCNLKTIYLKKISLFLEKKNEEIANHLFILQEKISNQIKSFYQNNTTNDLFCTWYIIDNSVHMKFSWMDREIILYSDNGKPVLSDCPKKLRKYILRQDTILEFMLLEQQYYTINEFPL